MTSAAELEIQPWSTPHKLQQCSKLCPQGTAHTRSAENILDTKKINYKLGVQNHTLIYLSSSVIILTFDLLILTSLYKILPGWLVCALVTDKCLLMFVQNTLLLFTQSVLVSIQAIRQILIKNLKMNRDIIISTVICIKIPCNAGIVWTIIELANAIPFLDFNTLLTLV